MKTKFSICKNKFLINGKETYEEILQCPKKYRGLLMNARFIQGIFEDRQNPKRFNRFGRTFDPRQNTDDLIAALPQWYQYGLRAITVGLQGGGPCFTIDSNTIDNNPFSEDGNEIRPEYLHRLKRIIEAADEIGMLVIVSCFYGPQSRFLMDDASVVRALKNACNWLRNEQFTNVIVEVANEHDIDAYRIHPILYQDSGIAILIDIARRESGGMPVGCSSTGAYFSQEITNASDVIFIHGNNMSQQVFCNQIAQVKSLQPERPIVCNEDSPSLTNMLVALDEGVSWGYYNNMTKQEPPADWGITKGEDTFFALRMASSLGIPVELPGVQESFYLQGLRADECYEGKRWIRLASLYPEKIQKVSFFRNGTYLSTVYESPFSIGFLFNWIQRPVENVQKGEVFRAEVVLAEGSTLICEEMAQ